jgi:phosphosulfolactate phosphohydrolase-like enzyme
MGAIVVACVEPREPAAEEDWVEAEAITESLKKKKRSYDTKIKLRRQNTENTASLYFSLISVTGELQYIYIYIT